ncbi:MAG: immune inhibitor A domain-containing protein [Neobacillus sp.]
MKKKNRSRKVFSSITATMIIAGSLFAGTIAGTTSSSQKALASTNTGAPFDLGIANDERLIEMLKREGKLAENASPAEAEKALQKYLKNKAAGASKETGELHQHEKKLQETLKDNLASTGLVNGKGNKLGQTKKGLDSVKEEEWSEGVRQDDILVVLIEYPDAPATNITEEDTDMYYEEYTKEHYAEMLFGDDEGYYTGPNGEKLVSVKKFYEEQSGGSYTIGGDVVGWYKAKNPAAYYGGNNASSNDARPRNLVYEAIVAAAEAGVDLNKYDKEDRYDLDGDGNYREPDGLIDHLMIVHSSVGEEAGGGQLGEDAIWSHRWNLGGVATIPGSVTDVPYWGGKMAAYDYTIEPADGAAGVFAHEYGHDLGLPDEYDTIYSGAGEAVAYWSIMSSGSWAGAIPGTEPTGFSPWAKEFLHASMPGSNWLTGTTIHSDDVTNKGVEILIDQASSKGSNHDAVRIDLPGKQTLLTLPSEGEQAYFGGSGDEINHTMEISLDLRNYTDVGLEFDSWYKIEEQWDFAFVQVSSDGVNWTSLGNENTRSDIVEDGYPSIIESMPGFTGNSNGWVKQAFDLSEYAGEEIQLRFSYQTDWGTTELGFFADNIKVLADGQEIFSDGGEEESTPFTLDGFELSDGYNYSTHYYLLEWRSHNGVDEGLKNIRRGASLMSYDPGLVVWYVDETYDNNWTGVHPGEGFLGVVDADQNTLAWSDKSLASSRYQIHDAAFSLNKTEKMFLDYKNLLGITMTDNFTQRTPLFDDSTNYLNTGMPDAGRNVPTYGLKFRVVGESADGTVGKVLIFK